MKKFEGMILACDMDGTLLDDDRQISQGNQQALRYFTQEGGRFSLATGRAPQAIHPYIPQLGNTAEWCKINFTGKPEQMENVRMFLKPYTDRFCMASSMPAFCEITASRINKGSALRQIAADCGIAENRIFAIGDSYNDEAMLQAAHIGFAPSNSDEDILRTADVVVCSNNEDAVAQAIEYMEAHYC